MILDQTKKIIILVCIFLLLFVGIVLVILVPTLINIKKTSAESYKLRLILEQKYEQSLHSRVTKQRLAEVKETIADFDDFIFRSGDELKLITFLESLANKHNLNQTITSSNLDKLGADRLAQISMNLTGNYDDVLQYITDLESSKYFISIEQMRIKPAFDKNGNTEPIAILDLTTKLYVNK